METVDLESPTLSCLISTSTPKMTDWRYLPLDVQLLGISFVAETEDHIQIGQRNKQVDEVTKT
jgi:hypothetical protein